MTGMVLMFSALALMLVIWVLRRNAQDRQTFEEALVQGSFVHARRSCFLPRRYVVVTCS